MAFLAGATEIQMLLFLPLALVHLRARRSWPVVGALVLGLGMQVVTTLAFPRPPSVAGPPGVASVIQGYLTNTVLPLFVNSPRVIGRVMSGHGILLAFALFALFVVCAVFVLIAGTVIQRALAVALLVGSIVAFSAGYYLNPNTGAFYALFPTARWLSSTPLLRYGVASGMLLAALVPLAAAVLVTARSARSARSAGSATTVGRAPRAARLGAVAMLAVAAVVMTGAAAFSVPVRQPTAPPWATQVAAIHERCLTLPASTRLPVYSPPRRWHNELSCALVLGKG